MILFSNDRDKEMFMERWEQSEVNKSYNIMRKKLMLIILNIISVSYCIVTLTMISVFDSFIITYLLLGVEVIIVIMIMRVMMR